jgi:hypothetical protein
MRLVAAVTAAMIGAALFASPALAKYHDSGKASGAALAVHNASHSRAEVWINPDNLEDVAIGVPTSWVHCYRTGPARFRCSFEEAHLLLVWVHEATVTYAHKKYYVGVIEHTKTQHNYALEKKNEEELNKKLAEEGSGA